MDPPPVEPVTKHEVFVCLLVERHLVYELNCTMQLIILELCFFLTLGIYGSIVHVEAGAPVTEKNMVKRLRRVMTPRADGSSLVPQEILDAWKDTQTGGRDAVLKMFSQCSGDKETLGMA